MKQAQKQGKNNKIGAIGEKLAEKYLQRLNLTIIDTNYLKKWGEIDIVARETKENVTIIHFVEVKTVSYETKHALLTAVSHGTWKPEDNVHIKKLERMRRTIETWIEESGEDYMNWQIDIIAVRIVPTEKYASIKYLDNVII